MFHIDQIITATQLIRHYKQFAKLLLNEPQALLVTHKSGQKLVIVSAEIFSDLVHQNFGRTHPQAGNPRSHRERESEETMI